MRIGHAVVVQFFQRGEVGFEQRVLPLLFELEHGLLNAVRSVLLLRESRQGPLSESEQRHGREDDREQKGSFHGYSPFKNNLSLFGFTALIPPAEWVCPAVAANVANPSPGWQAKSRPD